MIRVGITELHGIADEYSQFPAKGVDYSLAKSSPKFTDHIFKSPAKGVLSYYGASQHDILEAPLFPILTNKPWIFTPARFTSGTSFTFFGLPTPKSIRVAFISKIMLRENFKKLIFKSHAGRETLFSYGKVRDQRIIDKTDVVYPAIRRVDDSKIRYQDDKINILFSGDFLRKGGANVVDAFIRLSQEFDHVYLRVCSSSSFQTSNADLQNEYLAKIDQHDRITFGYVDRKMLMDEILPDTDIYLCPTYQEAWGFSIEEAMGFGIPIVATNHFAIPEMVEHEKSAFLIDTAQFEYIRSSKGYIINEIPEDFMNYMTDQVYAYTKRLIEDLTLRKEIGMNALHTAREKFSMEARNKRMLDIYNEALR